MKKKFRQWLKILGPGFITGASDDDPSGIGTYSQTGALFGYTQLWTLLFSLPFMIAIQEMCGRIGLVTGAGLAQVIRKHYSKRLLFFIISILIIANTINIGADLGAMAAAAQLLVPLPFTVLLLSMTFITLALEVFVSYATYTKYLKYLTLSLFAYVAVLFVVKQDWSAILMSTLIPQISFNRAYLLNIAALLGTTISPYLFFWQANQEAEEDVAKHKIKTMGVGKPKVSLREMINLKLDTSFGMFFSNAISFFIIVSTASTLHKPGGIFIGSAAEAAQALEPLAGRFAAVLFGLGVIGTGLLAVPVLAGSASYALSEAFGWHEGLYRKFNQAHGFYGIITLATLVGLLINYLPIKPFALLYYTAILNGICAPPLMFVIMLIANNKKIMGKHTNSPISNLGGWVITAVMSIVSVLLLLSFIKLPQ